MARRDVHAHGRFAYGEDAPGWDDSIRETGTFEKRPVPAVQIANLDPILSRRDFQMELGDGRVLDRKIGETRAPECV